MASIHEVDAARESYDAAYDRYRELHDEAANAGIDVGKAKRTDLQRKIRAAVKDALVRAKADVDFDARELSRRIDALADVEEEAESELETFACDGPEVTR